MANVKNFGLVGVGSTVQYGKAGPVIGTTGVVFNLKAANGTTDAALTTAGITSSAGSVTLTTGSFVGAANTATLSLGDAGTLVRQGTGVFQFTGTGALMLPVGTGVQEPTGAVGMIRVNTDGGSGAHVEYYTGAAWSTLGSSADLGLLQTEVDNIETSLGDAVNTDGTFDGSAFVGTPFTTPPVSFTDAINEVAAFIDGKDILDEIFPSSAAGNVIYADGGNLWAQAAPGATSGVQGYDAGLAALAAKTSTGILVQTGADTYSSTSLVAPVRGFTITNADGVAGAPTFVLANNLAALEANTTPGYYVITADGTSTSRSIAGTTNNIVVTNGDGVTSDTSIDLAAVTQAATGTFVKITLDGFGRTTGNTAVTTSDITGLVDSQYLRLDGTTTMTADLNVGGNKVTSLAEPTASTDAATKNYVDNAVTGLTWKTAALAASTGNLSLTGLGAVDGITPVDGSRILVKNQTAATDNGIYIAHTGAWTRSTDAATGPELDSAAIFVQQGTINGESGWVQTASNITIGVTPIVWTQFSGSGSYTGGVGIDISGNVISALLGAGIGELPTGDIGLDLFNATTGALILTDDGTTRSTDDASQLFLLLDTSATGGLDQGAAGLFIKAAGVTNAQLVNSTFGLNADSGTVSTVGLGQTLEIAGTAAQGISTVVSGQTVTITAADATVLAKGVASFNTASFTVTAGAVSLNVVDVPHGGTGVTTLVANEILYGAGTAPVAQSAAFTFDGTDTLTVGTTTIQGGVLDTTITATATNGDIVLLPNGTGSVIVGPVGAGIIQSDAGTALTVTGNTTLTLNSVTGTLTLGLPTGTGSKVTVSGPTAADYATGLGASDLTNKQYVDDAIAAGATAGSIKAVVATIDLSAGGTTNIGAILPAGATILSVKVQVTAADTGTGTLSVGKAGTVAAYMTTAEVDNQGTGIYIAEDYVVEAGAVQVIATVAGTPASGSANVIVEYKVAG